MKIVKNTDNAVLKDKSEVSDKEAEEALELYCDGLVRTQTEKGC